MESPEYVKTSLAAAITLGLSPGRFMDGVQLTGLNLLLTYESGCKGNCGYCGLARTREGEEDTFIRVDWPILPLDAIIERTRQTPILKRVCVGMVSDRRCYEDSLAVTERVSRGTGLPVSALVTPTVLKERQEVAALKAAGADRFTVAVDTATEELFLSLRGKEARGPHRWQRYWQAVEWGLEVFDPGTVGIHLVVGLGETEEEMIDTIQRAQDMGVTTHLFAFYPEPGSRLAHHPRPELGHYRRVQLARYLINQGLTTRSRMRFSEQGQLIDFGMDVQPHLREGAAFVTSGCPGEDGIVACNRPFGNERPGERFRNFPHLPSPDEEGRLAAELWQGVAPQYAPL